MQLSGPDCLLGIRSILVGLTFRSLVITSCHLSSSNDQSLKTLTEIFTLPLHRENSYTSKCVKGDVNSKTYEIETDTCFWSRWAWQATTNKRKCHSVQVCVGTELRMENIKANVDTRTGAKHTGAELLWKVTLCLTQGCWIVVNIWHLSIKDGPSPPNFQQTNSEKKSGQLIGLVSFWEHTVILMLLKCYFLCVIFSCAHSRQSEHDCRATQ